MSNDVNTRLEELRRAAGQARGEQLLLQALRDEEIALRTTAVALAARHMSPEALGDLVRQSESVALCNSAISALERQGPWAVPHLLVLAHDPDTRLALFAVQILARIREPSSEASLRTLLGHADANVVAAVIEALGHLRATDAVPELLPFLRAEMWLQFAVITALGDIGDERAIVPLLATLDDDMLATSSVEALGKIAGRAALAPLQALLVDADRLPLRDQVLLALGAIVDRHQPGPVGFGRLRRAVAADARLADYLDEAVRGGDAPLARATARLVMAARLRRLYAAAFSRAQSDRDVTWMAQQGKRFRAGLRGAIPWLLAHPDRLVRQAVLRCASFGDSAVTLVLPCLEDPDIGVREAACEALGRLGAVSAAPRLVQLLCSGSPVEQRAAAEALRGMPSARLAPLARCLERDSSQGQQLLALSVLEASGQPIFLDAVLSLAACDRPAVRAAALRVIALHPVVGPEQRLLVALHDASIEVGAEAIELLVRRGAHAAVPHVLRLLDTPNALRYHAIRAVGRLGEEEVVPALLALHGRALAHERIEVVVALARIGGPEVLPFLRAQLGAPEPDVRRAAADGLARHVGLDEVSVLAELATDEDWIVRNHAAWGLGRLGGAGATVALLALVRDVESVVARTARVALDRLRADGRESA